MHARDGILIALIIVAVLILVAQARGGARGRCGYEHMTDRARAIAQLDAEHRASAQPIGTTEGFSDMARVIHGRPTRSTVEDVAQAEQLGAMGYSGTEGMTGGSWGDHVTDLAVDEQTRANHRRWVTEMAPWSGVARSVDTLDAGNYLDHRGLRFPQPVAVVNPQQLTEIGPDELVANKKFNFNA